MITMKIRNNNAPNGMVMKANHPNAPQRQFPSWQGLPVDHSVMVAPIIPMIIGLSAMKIMVNNPKGMRV